MQSPSTPAPTPPAGPETGNFDPMTNPGTPHERREHLQARLETAVGRAELSIREYDELCARVWDDELADDSPELDAIAGRLERIESARPADTAPAPDPLHAARSDNPYRQPDPYRPRPEGRTDHGLELVGRTPDSDRQEGRPTLLSDKKFTGRWAPRADTTWWALFGEVKLDLRQADWPAERIVLDFQALCSDAKIIVPPGTTIVDDTTALLGEVKNKTSSTAPANGLTVVLDGFLFMSDLIVRDR